MSRGPLTENVSSRARQPVHCRPQLGHGGDALVRKMYGHLGVTRVWSDVVEYRV